MSSKKSHRRKRREEKQEASRSKLNPAIVFILAMAAVLAVIVTGAILLG